ncbi:redoxin domain-containing protein [Acidovorax sp. YS12]|nr:redoxin domain-containing protein [Acidovorax sp. YS12]
MGDTLRLGPLALPWGTLFLFAGWWLGTWAHERLARRQGLAPGPHGWRIGLAALFAARLGFVLQYPAEYAAAPWSVLDIRDGGWAPWWGLAAALAYAAVLAWQRSPWRRTVAVGLAAGAGLWLAGLAAQHWGGPGPAPLPRWQGVALDASTVALPALRGQPVVVNLWATWCPPCRREMPVLRQARAQYPQVRFLWIDQGEAPDVVQRFAAQQGLPPADVLLDPASSLGALLGRSALPTTLFFNAEGTLVAVRTGELSPASLAHHLAQILPKP